MAQTLRERLAGQLSVRLGFRVRAPELEDAKGFQRSGYRDDHMRWQSLAHGIVSHSTMNDCISYGFSISEFAAPQGKRIVVQAKEPPQMKGHDRMSALIEDVGSDGAFIIVHSGAVRDYVRRLVIERHGPVISKLVEIRVFRGMEGFDWLGGMQKRVLIDHSFAENAKSWLQEKVKKEMQGIYLSRGARALREGRSLPSDEVEVLDKQLAKLRCP